MNSLFKLHSSTRTRFLAPLLSLYSTSTKKKRGTTTTPRTFQQPPFPPVVEWRRPMEIPFQPKVANRVNLIGYVSSPVQSEASSDGKFWSATTITQSFLYPDSPPFWVPIIFEGDLAHTAAQHLKEKDCVFVIGQLMADPPSFGGNHGQVQSSVQVMVHEINFVQDAPQNKKSTKDRQEGPPANIRNTKASKSLSLETADKYLFIDDVENEKDATSQRMTTEESVDDSMPKQFQENIIVEQPSEKTSADRRTTSSKAGGDSARASWKELLDNPKEWIDYRASKLDQLVKPRHPDFKHKDSGVPIWLGKTPKWVLSKLDELEFDTPNNKPKHVNKQKGFPADLNNEIPQRATKKGDESWKDLVENPNKWWDNRLKKKNVRAPDFKHKDSGEVLWLNSAPTWVLPKLPPVNREEKGSINRRETLLS